ncbi:hypothetical protein PRUPE_6G158600 [Prunus persica]|uniref:Uncharacterized protein n=1 Tax=Prunus persica TaxID=3760 RepID=A0A251NRB7_PRUPE|nr:hypothetical protein PRUPE_6G158600 [Prunus persica]
MKLHVSFKDQIHLSLYYVDFEALSRMSKTLCRVISSTITTLSLDLEPEPIETCLLFTPKTCNLGRMRI